MSKDESVKNDKKFHFWQKCLTYANLMTIGVGILVAFAGNSIFFELHNEYTKAVFFDANEFDANTLVISIMVNTKCILFIEETAQIIAQYFLEGNPQNKELNGFTQSLEITNNKSGESIENYVGTLSFSNEKMGVLSIEMDRNWLKKNNVYSLPSENDFALSTTYGLLYLRLKFKPILTGELFQYQVLSDQYHMTQKPMLFFREKR